MIAFFPDTKEQPKNKQSTNKQINKQLLKVNEISTCMDKNSGIGDFCKLAVQTWFLGVRRQPEDISVSNIQLACLDINDYICS